MGNGPYEEFLELQRSKPHSSAARKAAAAAASASNFQPQAGKPRPGPFDAFRFDKAEAQARLEAAFDSTQSSGRGCKTVYTPLSMSGVGIAGDAAQRFAGEQQVHSPGMSSTLVVVALHLSSVSTALKC